MRNSEAKKFFKKVLIANLGFAMFGSPIVILFLQTIRDTTLLNAVGVVFVFFTIFITMHVGLDLIITSFRSRGRKGEYN